MPKIIQIILPILLPYKWLFGKPISFAKYDAGFVRVKVKEVYIKLMYHDIMYLTGRRGFTIYHMANGDSVIDTVGLGLSCMKLAGNHFGRYRKDLASNHHYHASHTMTLACVVTMTNGFEYTTSRDEATRFRAERKTFKAGVGMQTRRVRILKVIIHKKKKK